MDEQYTLVVALAEDDALPTEIDNLTSSLRRALSQTAVHDVRRAAAEAPSGSKGAGAVELGALLVNLLPSVLGSVVTVVNGWLSGHAKRSVTMTIDGDSIVLTDPSKEQQRMLVEAWLQRHSHVAQAGLGADEPGRKLI